MVTITRSTRSTSAFVYINGIALCKQAIKKAIGKGSIYGDFKLVRCSDGPIFIKPLRDWDWWRGVSISVRGYYNPFGPSHRRLLPQHFKRLYRGKINEKTGFKLMRKDD